MKQNQLIACLILITANVFFAGSFGLAKLLTSQVDVTSIMFFRFLAGPLYLIPFFLIKRKPIKMDRPWTLLVRICSGLLAMFCLFHAFKFGGIGKSMLIFNFAVFWTLLYGVLIKKEKPHRFSLFVIPILFLGLWFILKPEIPHFFISWGLAESYALLASFCNMGVYVSLKRVRETNDNSTVVLLTYFFCMLVLSVPFSQEALSIHIQALLCLLLMCSIGFVGQLLMSYSFKFNQAGVSSLVMLSGVPMFYISGFVFFNETISVLGCVGVLCVMFALGVISKYR